MSQSIEVNETEYVEEIQIDMLFFTELLNWDALHNELELPLYEHHLCEYITFQCIQIFFLFKCSLFSRLVGEEGSMNKKWYLSRSNTPKVYITAKGKSEYCDIVTVFLITWQDLMHFFEMAWLRNKKKLVMGQR